MTNELLPLLQRAEKAGAPLKLGRGLIPGQEAVHLSGLRPAGDVTIYLSYCEPLNTAALAHALRLDAQQRGASMFEVDVSESTVGVTISTEGYGTGRGDSDAEAWLLAWLDAFEDKQETTR